MATPRSTLARGKWASLGTRVGETRIVCCPAECASNCDIPGCPYLHHATWHVGDRVFETEKAAAAFVADLPLTPAA